MKPPPFEYVAATSIEQAVAELVRHGGDAKLLAGGQSLVPMLNFRVLSPTALIDINKVPGLDYIEPHGDGLRIGGLVRHHALETSELVAERFPVLSAAMTHVAHLAIRNRGTIGGSLAHADPAAELPMMARLLDAGITAAGADGDRTIPAAELFEGALSTALRDDEIVTGVELPALPASTGWGFEEFARRSGDFALAAAAATVTASQGVATEVRIALMGVDETPVRATEAEDRLTGHALDAHRIAEAAASVRAAVQPMDDLQASADYRRHLAEALTVRVLGAAWKRARGETT